MVLREVCLLLAVAALAQGDGHDGECGRVCLILYGKGWLGSSLSVRSYYYVDLARKTYGG